MPGGTAYWTVIDEDFNVVEPFNSYLRWMRLQGYAESTTRQYSSALTEWAAWIHVRGMDGDLMLWAEKLGLFRFHLLTTPIARHGRGHGNVRSEERVGDVLAAIRSFFKWAVAHRRVEPSVNSVLYEVVEARTGFGWLEDPPERVARPAQRTRRAGESAPVAVSVEEFHAMLEAPGMLRDKLCICLLGLEGMRVEEAVTIRRAQMHLSPNSASLGCPIKGPHLHVIGKGNKARWLPANPYLVSVYSAYLLERCRIPAAEISDYVLVNLKGGEIGSPMTTDRVRRAVLALAKRAGIERHVTPHQFRHGLATQLIEQNRSLDEVQQLLGHAWIETTRRYVRTSAGRLFEAVESVPLPGAAR